MSGSSVLHGTITTTRKLLSYDDIAVVFRPQYLPVLALRILFNYLYFYAVVAPEE